jgi:hypothetical protein
MDALALRYRGRLAAWEGDFPSADRYFKQAAGLYHELGIVFSRGLVLLDHAEAMVASDRAADAAPLMSEARSIFEQLQAQPSLDRLATAELRTNVSA